MRSAISLTILMAVIPGILAQVQLVQSGAEVKRPRESLRISCQFSGYTGWITWVRQKPEQGLEWMGSVHPYDSETHINPSIQGHVTISLDKSISTTYLQWSSLEASDTATYYCATDGCGSFYCYDPRFEYWGQGNPVTVSSVNPTSPKLFPLSLRSLDQSGHTVVGCLIQGFFPSGPMNVTWSHSGESMSIRNFPPVQATAEGLYTMSSQLTLSAAQCPDGATQTCHVEHNSSFSKDVDVPCRGQTPICPPSSCQPQLSLHRPALEDLLLGSNASLTCTLSGLKDSKSATFTWNPSGGKDAIQGTPQKDSCGCYSVSSILPGCAEPWKRGETFSCTVTHPDLKSPQTTTITKTSGSTFRPQVHLLPPPSEELALNELVTLTCLVRGFSPKDVLVRWLRGNQELPREKYLTWDPLSEAGQSVTTFTVTSVLRVEAEDWKSGDTFSCMVGHETLPLAFTQKTIDRLAGKPTHVNVSVVLSEVDGICY